MKLKHMCTQVALSVNRQLRERTCIYLTSLYYKYMIFNSLLSVPVDRLIGQKYRAGIKSIQSLNLKRLVSDV